MRFVDDKKFECCAMILNVLALPAVFFFFFVELPLASPTFFLEGVLAR